MRLDIPRRVSLSALAVLAIIGLLWLAGCSTATSRARLQPADVVTELVAFHGDVAEQMAAGGMEQEQFLDLTAWIGTVLRVVQTNPQQWEGQARLKYPRVRSIVASFEALAPWGPRLDRLVQ